MLFTRGSRSSVETKIDINLGYGERPEAFPATG